ncbi:hypothetical protein V6N12_004001 [Hibiscus sabdariffa]|uniref:Uncharacterized protein n=1 Tax=Hibiscus sabdariffa TaxID=183260 RepID=A0ABR2CK78_9ROSI
MHLELGEISSLVVSSPEIAKEVLITHGLTFSGGPYLDAANMVTYDSSDIVLAPYGNYWRQVRKLCIVELLTPKRVLSFELIRQEEVSGLVESVSSNQGLPINLTKMIFSMTYGNTSRAAFENIYKDQESYSLVVEETVKLASGFSLPDMFPSSRLIRLISGYSRKLEGLFRRSDGILQGIVNEHRSILERGGTGEGEAKEDLVTVLLKTQQSAACGESEKSSTTADWAMTEMLRNPRVLKKAQNEVRRVFHGKTDMDEAGLKELEYLTSVIKNGGGLPPFVTAIGNGFIARSMGINTVSPEQHQAVALRVQLDNDFPTVIQNSLIIVRRAMDNQFNTGAIVQCTAAYPLVSTFRFGKSHCNGICFTL